MTEYSIYHGDCLETLKILDEHSIDAIVTDPPFSFASAISSGRTSSANTQFFSFWWSAVCVELDRVLKPDGEGFLWCDWRVAKLLADGFRQDQKKTWRIAQMLFHYREMPGMGSPFRNSVDMIAYLRGPKSGGHRIDNSTENWLSQYWYYGKHPNHPSEKSVEVVKYLLDWCSDEGMTILDPFMGSGTTGIACLMTNRDFIGIELEITYYETAAGRLKSVAAGYDGHCKAALPHNKSLDLTPSTAMVQQSFMDVGEGESD